MGRVGVDTVCRARAGAGGGAGARKQTEHEQTQQLMKTIQHSTCWNARNSFLLGTRQKTLNLPGHRLFLLFMAVGILAYPQAVEAASHQITLDYPFAAPTLVKAGKDHSLRMPHTTLHAEAAGLPLLPVRTARILIPQGQEVVAVNVVPGREQWIDGSYILKWSSPPVPMGQSAAGEAPANAQVYGSAEAFPAKLYSVVSVQHLCGYQILLVNLYPVQYHPAVGRIRYHESLRVVVACAPVGPPVGQHARCRGSATDLARVARIVDNPTEADSYVADGAPLADSPQYDYIIITSQDLLPAFQELANWKASRGLTVGIATIEDIKASYDGRDDAETIRNFITDAYNNSGTTYVVLGGDADAAIRGKAPPLIPTRGVYGQAQDFDSTVYIEENMPCDMYFGALDGNWDNDGDGIFGEGDAAAGGTGAAGEEADFEAEVFVGRIPADDVTEALNQIHKIIAYESSLHTENALLVARQLDDTPTYGGDFKDLVYGFFPDTWEATRLYDRDLTYSQAALISALNSGDYHIVNNMCHANTTSDMGLGISQIAGLSNTRYFLAYSQGCKAGGFDSGGKPSSDCAGEYFTVENGSGGAFAYVGNSRYGWYELDVEEGESNHFDEQLFNAIFVEGIRNVGWALQASKEANLGRVGATGAHRWAYFGLNLLGDPETPITAEPPVPPDTTPPAAVADLAASTPGAYSVDLSWTAPGDDGTEGTATEYDIRYALTAIADEADWASATQCLNEPAPSPAGTLEQVTVIGLAPGTIYYLALKTVDEAGNSSELSNIASATTSDAPSQTMRVVSIEMSLKTAGANVSAIAAVMVVDEQNAPVAGAQVLGHWEGATTDPDAGVTAADGTVSLESDKVRKPSSGTTFTFTLDNVVLGGWIFDAGNSVMSGSVAY